ncbi:hypothetical protein AQUSIP_04110 [Aquicella siphonis]|uniref:Uncharacterized protein n=1 Tax=Aquicella siphonis TaxID=254247 RepID=A0A5E4PE81_9COXI|nr:hypothetical protein [Aquicella siphonis]VVC75134.1 hypothetical protein AQUSIP_04110 [Aquicella siphonis]
MSLSEHDKIVMEKIRDAVSILRAYHGMHKKHKKLTADLLERCQQALARISEQAEGETSDDILSRLLQTVRTRQQGARAGKIVNLLAAVADALTQIKSIVHPVFAVPKIKLAMSEIRPHKIDRICFRGDDRSPAEIFLNGFTPYAQGEEGIVSPFESDSDNVVAFTSRFAAATFFPFNSQKIWTNVYVFKARQGFDVHAHGYSVFAESGLNAHAADLLFVDELITDYVPPEDIIAAAGIIRMSYDPDQANTPEYLKKITERGSEDDAFYLDFYRRRGWYRIARIEMNHRCKVGETEKNQVAAFLQNEMKLNQQNEISASRIALPTSGYQRNGLFSASVTNKKGIGMESPVNDQAEKSGFRKW